MDRSGFTLLDMLFIGFSMPLVHHSLLAPPAYVSLLDFSLIDPPFSKGRYCGLTYDLPVYDLPVYDLPTYDLPTYDLRLNV